MNPAIFLTFALIVQIHAASICHFGEGVDMCHGGSKCAPMVVRPAKLPKLKIEDITKPRVVCKQIGGIPGLKPVGDLCSCKQSIVIPALVPRPVCPTCNVQKPCPCPCTCSSSSSSSSCGSSSCSGSSSSSCHSQPAPVYDHPAEPEPVYTAVADPVSLSLVYNMHQKKCGANEDRLAFGFRKLPIDGSKAKVVKHVAEELLFDLNGEVVELKPIACKGKTLSVDEEAMEDLVAEEFAEVEEAQEAGNVKHLSYGEIGFGPAKVSCGPFVPVQGGGSVSTSQSSSSCTDHACDCHDGFRPGNVIIKNTPQKEVYVPGPKCPEDCDSDEDTALPIRYVSSYSSSSSCSSSSSANHQVKYSCGN